MQVRVMHRAWTTRFVQAPYFTATWRLTSPDGDERYAKVGWTGAHPSLVGEAARTRWAAPHLPAPEVVDHGDDGRVEWLVLSALPGTDGTRVEMDPASLVRELGAALRRFHDAAPVAECPFDFRLDVALAHCADRVNDGTERWDDLHDEFKHMTPTGVLQELLDTRPSSEDLVVCHGDYCFPNMLLEHGRVTGYLDLGELGVADRWWDIAVGAWSVTWNTDPALEPLFYEGYGAEPDPGRTRFYRLLYDLAS